MKKWNDNFRNFNGNENMNPIALAFRAKGLSHLYRRSHSIAQRYGINTNRMRQALQQFTEVLGQFDCGATFPITAVTLNRHAETISTFLNRNIEFAIHGYTHIDYSQLTPERQLDHLRLACQIFQRAGIKPTGFRSPYLTMNDQLEKALEMIGFSYVSNQPFLWDVLDRSGLDPLALNGYERALAFYHPWMAGERLSLPRLNNHLVEIPVSLPDDEILIDRLSASASLIKRIWLTILAQTYQQGELFCLQLHPERIAFCADSLTAILSYAQALTPKVWCTRLDHIAKWWKTRTEAKAQIAQLGAGEFSFSVDGPPGTTILVRNVNVDVPTFPWSGSYRIIDRQQFTFFAPLRPIIGASPTTADHLINFLRQQGYLIEISEEASLYSYYLDQATFRADQERMVIREIEENDHPLIRLGRWPYGAQSALAITGDIDSLTIWDYGLRFLGK